MAEKMLRRIVAALLACLMLIGGCAAFAEETAEVDPETFVGLLAEKAMNDAFAAGKKLAVSGKLALDNMEALGLGEEAGLLTVLLAAMMYKTTMWSIGDVSQMDIAVTTTDGEQTMLDASIIVTDKDIYLKSGALDGKTLGLSFDKAATMATSYLSKYMEQYSISSSLEDLPPEVMLAVMTLANTDLYMPYISQAVEWISQTIVFDEYEAGFEPLAGHPEAARRATLTVTPAQAQALVSGIFDTFAADDALLGAIVQLVNALGSYMGTTDDILSVDEIKESLAAAQPMVSMFVQMLLKAVVIDNYYDAAGKLIRRTVDFGINTGEDESYDFSFIYDFTLDFGEAIESATCGISFPEGSVVSSAKTRLEPIRYDKATDSYSKRQGFEFSLEMKDTVSVTAVKVDISKRDVNTPGTEINTMDVKFSITGDSYNLRSLPISGFAISQRMETKFGEAGDFETILTQDLSYEGSEKLPSIHYDFVIKAEEAGAITIPADAIDVLDLTTDEWEELGETVVQNIMKSAQSFLEYIGIPVTDATVFESETVTEPVEVEAVPAG